MYAYMAHTHTNFFSYNFRYVHIYVVYIYRVSIKSLTTLIFRKRFKILKNREIRIQSFRGATLLRGLGMLPPSQGGAPKRAPPWGGNPLKRVAPRNDWIRILRFFKILNRFRNIRVLRDFIDTLYNNMRNVI